VLDLEEQRIGDLVHKPTLFEIAAQVFRGEDSVDLWAEVVNRCRFVDHANFVEVDFHSIVARGFEIVLRVSLEEEVSADIEPSVFALEAEVAMLEILSWQAHKVVVGNFQGVDCVLHVVDSSKLSGGF